MSPPKSPIRTAVGSEVRLKCVASGVPMPDIKWFKVGVPGVGRLHWVNTGGAGWGEEESHSESRPRGQTNVPARQDAAEGKQCGRCAILGGMLVLPPPSPL